jgi:hypothetical protein
MLWVDVPPPTAVLAKTTGPAAVGEICVTGVAASAAAVAKGARAMARTEQRFERVRLNMRHSTLIANVGVAKVSLPDRVSFTSV